MLINTAQQDALSELVNIGFGRAAGALSTLVGHRVILEAPELDLVPLEELKKSLTPLGKREITSVHQVFKGKLSGDALLLLDVSSASSLVDLLRGGEGRPHRLEESDRETLIETGNILLNAFIGSFGNLLQVHISFTVPHLRLESLSEMLRTLTIDNREVEFALVVRVHFRLTQGDVSGYLVIVMGIQSLEALFDAMREVGYFS